jgi:hypothetical protein
VPESIRTVRERAKPHGDSRPEHAGDASFPVASAASTRSCVIAIESTKILNSLTAPKPSRRRRGPEGATRVGIPTRTTPAPASPSSPGQRARHHRERRERPISSPNWTALNIYDDPTWSWAYRGSASYGVAGIPIVRAAPRIFLRLRTCSKTDCEGCSRSLRPCGRPRACCCGTNSQLSGGPTARGVEALEIIPKGSSPKNAISVSGLLVGSEGTVRRAMSVTTLAAPVGASA